MSGVVSAKDTSIVWTSTMDTSLETVLPAAAVATTADDDAIQSQQVEDYDEPPWINNEFDSGEVEPVVFSSLDSLPNYQQKQAESELKLTYFTMGYYSTPGADTGYYELKNSNNSDNVLTLSQSGLRKLVNNYSAVTSAVESLKGNPKMMQKGTYPVFVVNKFNDMSTRLVVYTYDNKCYIYLKLFTTNPENGKVYPTRKSVRFSLTEDIIAIGEFMKKNK